MAACLYFAVLLLVKRGHTYVCVHPKKFWCGRRIMGGVFAVGIPASIQNLLNVTGMTVLNNFTAAYGASAVAAMGIAQKINIVPMYVSMGISQGIMPLISYNYASGNVDRMKQTVRFSRKAALSIILLISAFYFLLPGVMVSLFMQDPEIVQYGSRFLRGFCLGLPFLCVDFLAVGVFQAVGMGKEALAFASCARCCWRSPPCLSSIGSSPSMALPTPSSSRNASCPWLQYWCSAGSSTGWKASPGLPREPHPRDVYRP